MLGNTQPVLVDGMTASTAGEAKLPLLYDSRTTAIRKRVQDRVSAHVQLVYPPGICSPFQA